MPVRAAVEVVGCGGVAGPMPHPPASSERAQGDERGPGVDGDRPADLGEIRVLARLRAEVRGGEVGRQQVGEPRDRRRRELPEALLRFFRGRGIVRAVPGLGRHEDTNGKPATVAIAMISVRAVKCQ